ncbi:MAG: helix-turn-helix transcriptional regulator [Caulobacteraceae bacterium]
MPRRIYPNHIRAWRIYRGLSQAELGALVGTTQHMICDFETGNRRLSAKWLKLFGPVFGAPPGVILDYEPAEAPTNLLELWSEIPEENRRAALNILKKLASPKRSKG